MKKLFILSLTILISAGLYAQQPKLEGEIDQIEYKVTVKDYKDQVNDQFYKYYALEVTNTSNNAVTFTPIYNYKLNNSSEVNSTSPSEYNSITLAAGETISGNIDEYKQLTFFKEYTVGNSGKKASDNYYVLESISVNK